MVLGQVMSENDPRWSVFWAKDGNFCDADVVGCDPPSASSLAVGKHVGEDLDTDRADETIGYIVLDEGGGALNGRVNICPTVATSVQH